MTKTAKLIWAIIIVLIIVVMAVYFWPTKQVNESLVNEEEQALVTEEDEAEVEESSTITILVPKDYDDYSAKMTEYSQVGGDDPLAEIEFVEKEMTVDYTEDLVKASAQAAAAEIAPSGGPDKAEVDYLKVEDSTAYVVLNIDTDGWAGVSVSQAIIHPLVEKTLLNFDEIDEVVFDYAVEDK